MKLSRRMILCFLVLLKVNISQGQIRLTETSDATLLARKLAGPGVSISNVTFTGASTMAGIFKTIAGVAIRIDSGIVLTNGKSAGIISDGQRADLIMSDNMVFPMSVPSGDQDLANLIGIPLSDSHDAFVLEFDFVPAGDSISFRYVFASEEYPEYACPLGGDNYNDAFAFFISGPGITGKKNIALIPGTNFPVTINNINDQPCAIFPNLYLNNQRNTFFTYNGYTKVLTASERVFPCQTYHLKIVIADSDDNRLDSGVFLEAGSLSSSKLELQSQLIKDQTSGSLFLVEGCSKGSLKIKKTLSSPFPQSFNLAYGGTAQNTIDVQTMPSSVVIPANQTAISIGIVPLADNVTEGREILKIYVFAGCTTGNFIPLDSASIEIRDPVRINAGNDTIAAFGQPVQLKATDLESTGATSYTWLPSRNLNNPRVFNPVATIDGDITYTVTGYVTPECFATDEIKIKAYKGPDIYVPRAFTPNGDGLNDILHATAIGMKSYHYFTIYDRWGKVVFNITKDFSRGWNGRFRGEELSTGTYIWIAESEDFNGKLIKRKGTLLLLR